MDSKLIIKCIFFFFFHSVLCLQFRCGFCCSYTKLCTHCFNLCIAVALLFSFKELAKQKYLCKEELATNLFKKIQIKYKSRPKDL